MICCLNPDCPKPHNPDGNKFCQSCSAQLVSLLRNRFRIVKLLSNEGGFGRTYLAEDIDKLNERCVVKQLAPKVQGTNALRKSIELFEDEAKRLGELGEHPQIPTLLAYFEQDNNLYLVQQFIDGQNLADEIAQQKTYTESQIRELLLDLLPILKFIHQRGVIHRDIKPPNIMRRQSDGRLVLIDFGASKQLTATVQTKMGTQIGSYGYTPIEQIQFGEAYPASDLFGLGATSFHLLTGTSPLELWLDDGYGWVTDWQQYLKSPVSSEFGKVLSKLLHKAVKERYQSAEDVIRDLTQKAPSPPVPPRVTPPSPVAVKKTISSTQPVPLPVKPPPPVAAKKPSSFIPPTQPAPLQVKPPPLSQTENNQLKNILLVGNRLLVGGCLLLLGLGGIWYWQSRPAAISVSSDSSQSTLTNFSLANTLKGHSNSVISVAISPDGRTLVSGSDDKTIKVWNLSTGQEIRTLNGHSNFIDSIAISPDGQTLVGSSSDKTIKVWNLSTGQEIRTLNGHSTWVRSVAISPDGRTLVSGSEDKTIKVWNLSTGQEIRTLKGHSSEVNSVAIGPDGRTLVSGSKDKTIKVWNFSTGQEIRTLNGHSDWVSSVAISPDGRTLVSGGFDTIRVWNLSTGQEIRTLNGHSSVVSSVAISPDGRTLVSGGNDNTIKVWNLSTGQEIPTLKGHSGSVFSVAISPDGRTLVSGSDDNTIKIWRVKP